MSEAVTCTIPGARTPAQVIDNTGAALLPALTDETMAAAREIYDRHIRAHVHARW
jgi:aryl-alcohol dehydrogenase-like predicted oxidoreductase